MTPRHVSFLVVAAIVVAGFVVLSHDAGEGHRVNVAEADAAKGAGDERKADAATAGVESKPATPERAIVGAEETAAETKPSRKFHGRVVDARRFPVEGAEVALVAADGAAVAHATTDAHGAFATSVSQDNTWVVSIVAHTTDGRAGYRRPFFATDSTDVDAGTITVDHATRLLARVANGAHPAAGARAVLRLGAMQETVADAIADESGVATFDAVPDGLVHVLATLGDSAGRARAFLPDEADVAIALDPLVAIDVIVMNALDKSPIAGAEISVSESINAPAISDPDSFIAGESIMIRQSGRPKQLTDAQGRAHIVGLPVGSKWSFDAHAAGFADGSAEWKDESLERPIALKPAVVRTVRFPVVAGEVAVPAANAPLTVTSAGGWRRREGEKFTATMGVAEIVMTLDGRGMFLARTNDGAIARLYVEENADDGNPISFFKARSITAHVVDAAGKPATGALVRAFDQGNNALGPDAICDGEGRATLKDLYPELANIHVAAPGGSTLAAHDSGSVDLTKGDASFEATLLEKSSSVRIAFRIDGSPALPARYRLSCGSRSSTVLEEFPERGELRLGIDVDAADAGQPMKVYFSGSGLLPTQFDVTPVASGDEPIVAVELTTAARIDVAVERSGADWIQVGLERQEATTGAWSRPKGPGWGGLSTPNGPADSFRFTPLEAGTYRATEQRSKSTSQSVTVAVGGSAQVRFRLTTRARVSGHVVAPAGTDLSRVIVVVEGQDLAAPSDWKPQGVVATEPAGQHVKLEDGSFEIDVPGDRDVQIHAWHPWLAPAESGGRVTTRGGATNVVLALVEGQAIRLPAPQLSGSRFERFSARVGVYANKVDGEPSTWLAAPLVGGALQFGGVAMGRATLLVDVGALFAPLTLEGVAVHDGLTELPTAEFTPGSSLRVRVLTSKGLDAPRIYVFANRLDAPTYHRDLNSRGEREVVLPGFGAGKFHVTIGRVGDFSKKLEQDITLDGATDVTVDFDLR